MLSKRAHIAVRYLSLSHQEVLSTPCITMPFFIQQRSLAWMETKKSKDPVIERHVEGQLLTSNCHMYCRDFFDAHATKPKRLTEQLYSLKFKSRSRTDEPCCDAARHSDAITVRKYHNGLSSIYDQQLLKCGGGESISY